MDKVKGVKSVAVARGVRWCAGGGGAAGRKSVNLYPAYWPTSLYCNTVLVCTQQVNELFRDVAALVEEQGVEITNIESSIEVT
jgi:hypothetical protein